MCPSVLLTTHKLYTHIHTHTHTHRSLKDMVPQIVTILGLDALCVLAVLGPGGAWQ